MGTTSSTRRDRALAARRDMLNGDDDVLVRRMKRWNESQAFLKRTFPEGAAERTSVNPEDAEARHFTRPDLFRPPAWIGCTTPTHAVFDLNKHGEALPPLKPFQKQLACLTSYFATTYPDSRLSKGTLLYHTSHDLDPVETLVRNPETMLPQAMFFGYDATIAALYATEMNQPLFTEPMMAGHMERAKDRTAWLNVYELTRDVPFLYADEMEAEMGEPVMASEHADDATVHPQFGLHVQVNARMDEFGQLRHNAYYSNLSTEITLSPKLLKEGIIQLRGAFRLNITKVGYEADEGGAGIDVGACVDPMAFGPVALMRTTA
jgi:hypothetical protein